MTAFGQTQSLATSLNNRVGSKIVEHIQATGKSLPASVKSVDETNTIVTLNFETDGTYTLPEFTMPLQGTEYVRVPIKQGDKGMIVAHDLSAAAMSGQCQTPASFTPNPNLTNLVFHPVGNKDFSKTDDPKAVLHYGPNGTISRDDKKKSQIKAHPDNGTSMSTGGTGDGQDGPHNVKATTNGTETNTTNTHKTNAPNGHSVSNDQSVGGNNAVTKNITAGQNISAGGTVSAPTGAFGTGSMGGLSLAGGLMQGAGGGGSTALMIDTGSASRPSAVKATLIKTGGYTCANLVNVLGQTLTQTDAGTRAHVTDFGGTAPYTFAQPVTAVSGGGTVTLPVMWDGQQFILGG